MVAINCKFLRQRSNFQIEQDFFATKMCESENPLLVQSIMPQTRLTCRLFAVTQLLSEAVWAFLPSKKAPQSDTDNSVRTDGLFSAALNC